MCKSLPNDLKTKFTMCFNIQVYHKFHDKYEHLIFNEFTEHLKRKLKIYYHNKKVYINNIKKKI